MEIKQEELPNISTSVDDEIARILLEARKRHGGNIQTYYESVFDRQRSKLVSEDDWEDSSVFAVRKR